MYKCIIMYEIYMCKIKIRKKYVIEKEIWSNTTLSHSCMGCTVYTCTQFKKKTMILQTYVKFKYHITSRIYTKKY